MVINTIGVQQQSSDTNKQTGDSSKHIQVLVIQQSNNHCECRIPLFMFLISKLGDTNKQTFTHAMDRIRMSTGCKYYIRLPQSITGSPHTNNHNQLTHGSWAGEQYR